MGEDRGTNVQMIRWWILAFVVFLAGCTGGGAQDGGHGLSDAERAVVERYLFALERGDVQVIAGLGLPTVDGTADAGRRVAAVAGRHISRVSLVHSRDFGPDLTRIEISGRYDDQSPYAEAIALSRQDDRWHLVLDNPSPRSPRPASTSRS